MTDPALSAAAKALPRWRSNNIVEAGKIVRFVSDHPEAGHTIVEVECGPDGDDVRPIKLYTDRRPDLGDYVMIVYGAPVVLSRATFERRYSRVSP